MRGVDNLHKSERVLTQGQILRARQRSPPFYQKLRQHNGFVENVCSSMKKTMKCQCYTCHVKLMDQKTDRPEPAL